MEGRMKAATLFTAIAALLSSASSAAFAEDAPHKVSPCAPVYGTWRTTHVMDQYGNPQSVAELAQPQGWPNLLMEARIDKDKAVLVWFGGKKKVTFGRTHRYPQNAFGFNGISKNGEDIEASSDYYAWSNYPSDKCYIKLIYNLKGEFVHTDRDHLILMEKLD